jgi:hypothetical protein
MSACAHISDALNIWIRICIKGLKMVLSKFKFVRYIPLLFVFAAPSALATTCYEYKETAQSVDCGEYDGRSADFSIHCIDIPASFEQVAIPCPFRWVNTNGRKTHAEVCAAEGMKVTSVGDEVCSSGERRAPNTYNFMYGKWGGVGSAGGDHTTSRTFTNGNLGRDGVRPDSNTTYQYCWGKGQKKDYDSTDIVTAFPCAGQ